MIDLVILMDSIDKKLIFLLRENARLPTSELARHLGISRSTVQSRLQRLQKQQVIHRYTVQFGNGYEKALITAHVLLKLHQKLTASTYNELKKIPEISSLYAISGDNDLIAILKTESTEKLSTVLDKMCNLPGVERTTSSVVLETKFDR